MINSELSTQATLKEIKVASNDENSQKKEDSPKNLLKEINSLKNGDAKLNFLLENNNKNWNALIDLGSSKSAEIINTFLSKLDSNDKQPKNLSKLINLPIGSSYLSFSFISEQVKNTNNVEYISEILKKGFESGGKAISALLLSNVLFEQMSNKIDLFQGIKLILDIMQNQAESASFNSFLFGGLLKSFNKNILERIDSKSSVKLLFEISSRLRTSKLDFDSFPTKEFFSKINVNEIKQLGAEQVLALTKSNMSLEQKEIILNKFFVGETKNSISGKWTEQNQRQLFKILIKKHLIEFNKVLSIKEKTESNQKLNWIDFFSSALKVAGINSYLRKTVLGNV